MKNKNYIFIGTFALLLGSFFLAAKYYRSSQREKLSSLADKQSERFIRDYSPRKGDPNAKVTLVEFLDPECESCRASYPSVKGLLEEFKGQLNLVVRYAAFHGNSKTVIKALEASKLQGKYWEALEILFATQPQWGSHYNPKVDLIYDYLPRVGIDVAALKKEMGNPKYDQIILQDAEDLKALGVRKTPTFFIN